MLGFCSNVLNGIPVVGHVKAGIHALAGDGEGAKQAVNSANRSSAVMAGGAVGSIGGPAGAIAGGMAAGSLMDVAESAVTGKPTGIVKGVDMIGTDIKNGQVPVMSVCVTSLTLCSDALGGLGGAGMADAVGKAAAGSAATTASVEAAKGAGQEAAKTAGKQAAKSAVEKVAKDNILKTVQLTAEEAAKLMGKEVTKAATKEAARTATKEAVKKVVIETTKTIIKEEAVAVLTANATNAVNEIFTDVCTDIQDRESSIAKVVGVAAQTPSTTSDSTSPPTSTDQNTSSGTSGSASSSGSQPPQRPQGNNNNQGTGDQQQTLISVFLAILSAASLNDVLILGVAIFKDLHKPQLKKLKILIKALSAIGILKLVVDTVLGIFKKVNRVSDVSFVNFLSLGELVAEYIREKLQLRHDQLRKDGNVEPDEQLRGSLVNDILSNIEAIITKCFDLFTELWRLISNESALIPNFRDVFTAVSHYYKHRKLRNGKVLSVTEYYNLIRRLLEKVKNLPEYGELTNPTHPRKNLECDIYLEEYGAWFRIALSTWGTNIFLSTCFDYLPISYEKEEDGDVHVIRNP